MGWTGTDLRGRKADRSFFEREFRGMTIHDYHEGKDAVYLVAERPSHPGEKFAVIVATERQAGWLYYNDMSEHLGPYYYGCPVRLLDQLTPTLSEEANKWREACRQAA